MRKSRLAVALLCLFTARTALATVNHGDFIGGSVDFLQVSETTQTAGDPEPIWDAPVLAGSNNDQLLFAPTAFISSCNNGTSDVTSSDLTTTIQAQAGVHIETVMLAENGDVNLTTFPPFGAPTTNASASLSGTLTVIEDISGPIAPVAIPFVGGFTPTGSFALPTNFGTSLWTGSISIDVASVVPNATKAVLELTNDLATNCAPGNTTARIQKKVVSGPAVALMVNPLACDLEVEKTCCVTQPVLADFGSCEGDLLSLTLEFTGDGSGSSNNDQGHKFRCHGRRRIEGPAQIDFEDVDYQASKSSDVMVGDRITITSSTGTFKQKTKMKTTGHWWRKQHMELDTSCDRGIKCGDQFGAYKVVGLESTLGGVVDCDDPQPPPVTCVTVGGGDPAGTPCDAKLVDMVLEYNGQACQDPLGNPQNGEADCIGDATGAVDVGVIYTGMHPYWQTISPASGINDGDRIRVTASRRGGLTPNQKFKIVDSNGVLQTIDFHVSCSQPLALGDEFGSFKLVEWTTKNGTTLVLNESDPTSDACEVPLAPPGPHCTSDLENLTLVYIGDYLGEGCTVSNPQGGYGKCIGVADPGDPVSVSPGAGLSVEPVDQIEFGDTVTISKTSGGDLPSLVRVTATGDGGSQTIEIKASCQKPLSLGDRFGSFVVFGMDREDDGPITLGGNIQYQYKVTNPNPDPVDNVEVTDDQLGVVASGETLAPGEMRTFLKTATLYGTTTNVATVTGDVGGDICNPGTDQVTVGVRAPRKGSFSCSDPISELTVIWNGAQTVDVKAWTGAPNTSTLITIFDDVVPGDAITVDSFGASYPTLEIFDTTRTTKLGQSSFDLWCNDKSMNGIEDCGRNNGNLQTNDPSLNNDWLLEGMVDSNETLECTPGLIPNPPACGFGPELVLVMPALMWLHRRRLKRAE